MNYDDWKEEEEDGKNYKEYSPKSKKPMKKNDKFYLAGEDETFYETLEEAKEAAESDELVYMVKIVKVYKNHWQEVK